MSKTAILIDLDDPRLQDLLQLYIETITAAYKNNDDTKARDLAPLIRVRSNWVSPGRVTKPGEYRILLSSSLYPVTFRVVGSLDENSIPIDATIQYKDWQLHTKRVWKSISNLSPTQQAALDWFVGAFNYTTQGGF